MEEKIILAIIGLVGGAVGSMFAPWANWGIEKRRQKLAYRKELIAKWRNMISWAHFAYTHRVDEDKSTFTEILEQKEDFFSLKPHLTSSALEKIEALRVDLIDVRVKERDGKIRPTPLSDIVSCLTDEVARIEREWKLV